MVNYRLQFFSESLGCYSFYLYICTLKYNNSCILLAMKHLTIRHFGPVDECVLDMSRVNLIIGTQGSGKSCVMMIACYCTWVEKRIVLRQSAKEFEESGNFLEFLISYYHVKGYVHPDTFIAYKTDFLQFSYDHTSQEFSHSWGKRHWSYKRPKVSYVPAERNMVSLVSNWSRLETNYDNILDFKADWDTARSFVKRERDILGLGVSYEYDEKSGTDSVITKTGKRIELTDSSSGMQSLIPQFVHLDYLSKGIYEVEKSSRERSFSGKQLVSSLLDILYLRYFNKQRGNLDEKKTIVHIEGRDFVFADVAMSKKFQKGASQLLLTDHAEIFLEEPESNLFPPTQFQLMNWIVELASNNKHRNFFFIATHSPYVLNHLLQENLKDFRLFLTYPSSEGLFKIKTATEEDVQGIYDNGADVFFNFDPFTIG